MKSAKVNGKNVSMQIFITIFGLYVRQCIYTAKKKVLELTFNFICIEFGSCKAWHLMLFSVYPLEMKALLTY